MSSHWIISFINAKYNRIYLETHLPYKIIQIIIQPEYEIGFWLEGLFSEFASSKSSIYYLN